MKQNLITVSAAFGESDEVAVGRFDAFYTPVLDFTPDNDKLITALKGVDLGNQAISQTATGTGPLLLLPLEPGPSGADGEGGDLTARAEGDGPAAQCEPARRSRACDHGHPVGNRRITHGS